MMDAEATNAQPTTRELGIKVGWRHWALQPSPGYLLLCQSVQRKVKLVVARRPRGAGDVLSHCPASAPKFFESRRRNAAGWRHDAGGRETTHDRKARTHQVNELILVRKLRFGKHLGEDQQGLALHNHRNVRVHARMQVHSLGLQSVLPRHPFGHRCPSHLDGLSNGLAEFEDDAIPKWSRNRVGLEGVVESRGHEREGLHRSVHSYRDHRGGVRWGEALGMLLDESVAVAEGVRRAMANQAFAPKVLEPKKQRRLLEEVGPKALDAISPTSAVP